MIEKLSWLLAEPELVIGYMVLIVSLIVVWVITTVRAAVITSGRTDASSSAQAGSWVAVAATVAVAVAFVWVLVVIAGGVLG